MFGFLVEKFNHFTVFVFFFPEILTYFTHNIQRDAWNVLVTFIVIENVMQFVENISYSCLKIHSADENVKEHIRFLWSRQSLFSVGQQSDE